MSAPLLSTLGGHEALERLAQQEAQARHNAAVIAHGEAVRAFEIDRMKTQRQFAESAANDSEIITAQRLATLRAEQDAHEAQAAYWRARTAQELAP